MTKPNETTETGTLRSRVGSFFTELANASSIAAPRQCRTLRAKRHG
ncbi:hypothetical protein [Fulvimarina endophytica]|nr:hypothetical protein [Fulvimarina endophytica]